MCLFQLFSVLSLLALFLGTPALADDFADCEQQFDPNRSISSCTRIIESGGGFIDAEAIPRDLHSAERYAIRDNIRFALVLNFGAFHSVAHAVSLRRYGIGRVKEGVDALGGEGIVLRPKDNSESKLVDIRRNVSRREGILSRAGLRITVKNIAGAQSPSIKAPNAGAYVGGGTAHYAGHINTAGDSEVCPATAL